ncbi:MAG: 1-deoxy-D-xylulose-5-phosphate synthase [bacterium]|nr:1-deoxy-D-xylulose-5-phosphate synthase [bacterium]
MTVLNKINYPSDLKQLDLDELKILASEIRDKIINTTSNTGGHLASNLGVVELTIALHYAFNTPSDKLVWDVSHQTYTHKIITGRKDFFNSLRTFKGCSGFTSREESEYDCFGAGHAGTSISAALGMAAGRDKNKTKEKIVAVLGDGSLTNGVVLEGLNNIAHVTDDLVIILNDNKMSISENVGGFRYYLNDIIQRKGYNKFRNSIKNYLNKIPNIGNKIHKVISKIEEATKSIIVPGVIFEEMGMRYIGPIDGHDIKNLVKTFNSIKDFKKPVIIHTLTEKGRGYKPAELRPDKYHGVGKFDTKTGNSIKNSNAQTFSNAFGESILKLAEKHEDVVGITAAMCAGTALSEFAEKYPNRFFDVGIAEEHAVVFSAGMATNGLRPIFAVYSTFLQRALACVYHDICVQNLPVIICTDRSGIVEDGPTHHGIYSVAYLKSLPNLSILTPSNDKELDIMLTLAYNSKSPVIIRYPKAAVSKLNYAVNNIIWGKANIIKKGGDLSIWAAGNECQTALTTADILSKHGIEAEVINTLFLKPFDNKLLTEKAKKMPIITIEDNCKSGGLASIVDEILINVKHKKILHFGWGNDLIPHGSPNKIRESLGLTAANIAKTILADIN